MKKNLLFCIILFLAVSPNIAQAKFQPEIPKSNKQFFIENKGQWPNEVLYLTNISGIDAWITLTGIVYDFYKLEEVPNFNAKKDNYKFDKFEHENYYRIGHVVMYKLVGSSVQPLTEGKQRQEAYYNYFLGNDQNKYATNVGLFKEVLVKNVYDGIDIRYYFDQGSIRYDFIVNPHADVTQIKFYLEGTDKVYVIQNGNLAFNTRFGEMAMAELF